MRYVHRHKVESVPPAVFVEAAAAEGDPVTYAAVFRFCSEHVPDFRSLADFRHFTQLLQQDDAVAVAG